MQSATTSSKWTTEEDKLILRLYKGDWSAMECAYRASLLSGTERTSGAAGSRLLVLRKQQGLKHSNRGKRLKITQAAAKAMSKIDGVKYKPSSNLEFVEEPKKASKKGPKKGNGKLTASDFIRTQPTDVTAAVVVEAGKKRGLKFSQNLVYAVRKSEGDKKRTPRVAGFTKRSKEEIMRTPEPFVVQFHRAVQDETKKAELLSLLRSALEADETVPDMVGYLEKLG